MSDMFPAGPNGGMGMRWGPWLVIISVSASLAACGTVNVGVDRLNTITVAATGAEAAYIKRAVDADCQSDLLERAFKASAPGATLDVNTPCASFADTRLLDQYDALLKGIVVYTAALQAEIKAGSTRKLDDATRKAAKQFGAAATAGGVIANVGPGGTLTTAAGAIADWVAGRITYHDATKAAREQQGNLEKIVAALESVNTDIALHMSNDRAQRVADAKVLALSAAHSDPAVRFLMNWRVLEIEGLAPGASAALNFDPGALNSRLDELVKCNASIAAGQRRPESACAAPPAIDPTAPGA